MLHSIINRPSLTCEQAIACTRIHLCCSVKMLTCQWRKSHKLQEDRRQKMYGIQLNFKFTTLTCCWIYLPSFSYLPLFKASVRFLTNDCPHRMSANVVIRSGERYELIISSSLRPVPSVFKWWLNVCFQLLACLASIVGVDWHSNCTQAGTSSRI